MLQLLNNRADADDSHHIVRMREFFVFQVQGLFTCRALFT